MCIIYSIYSGGLFAQYTSQTQPLPTRFFPASSDIVDFPLGQIQEVSHLLTVSGSMFIMYYAPWCSRSMRARDEFERASRLFSHNVSRFGTPLLTALQDFLNILNNEHKVEYDDVISMLLNPMLQRFSDENSVVHD